MQISANNLLQAAQQALSAKPAPAPAPRQPAAPSFEPMSFSSEPSEASATAPQGAYQRPGSQVDIKI
jgi:hypothetical protein